jgi:hypothetical protein
MLPAFVSASFFSKATQNVETIPGRIGRQKIRNGVPGASRAREKLDRPLRDSWFLYMDILA